VEVGNIFKLGTHFSEAFGCNYLDQSGQTKPVVMGSYGIGSGRLLACIAEEHHDQYGLTWPVTVTPYAVQMVLLGGKNKPGGQDTRKIADQLYHQLNSAAIEVLLDDRDESPGVKFNDADLIGNPLRVTVSERALSSGGVEYKHRALPEKEIIPIEQVITRIAKDIQLMEAEATARCVEVPYQ
ncbi:MAG TPA: His/Gly/Thr/Pro-type tRNA ligase C-terminal domain-containing protein, partial [Anaerolineales bacterium]|nr:His/Gly/Thr/Pro-type tRNA ligase C-terminal domain-containing protein [Anaerolineales bacterium]